jgi:hypothetical protein
VVSIAAVNFGAKSASVGLCGFSLIPTSPLASAVRFAASICSATRLLPCFVLS